MSRWRRWLAEARNAMVRDARDAWRVAVATARLALGIPDYDAYVAHVRAMHPEAEPMSRDAFHRERMEARYGRGRSRCC